ncbi:MAG: hypothetical protein IJJ06_04970 [Mogibacterium sp.]|nr:hypothetical protein [Mogibacterium sp.]
MTNAIDARAAIAEWFETDFKDSAKATTKTSRLDDGRLSYSFSVVNNSGFDFENFSFKIKVIDRTNNVEIGTASINAGKWASGEKKNFKSRLAIPAGVRNLSFVMYANSLDYTAIPADGVVPVVREYSGKLQDFGDAISGADGSGGIFGELFGTGGMPDSAGKTVTTRTTTTRNANGTTTRKTTTTTTTRKPNSGTVNTAPANQNSSFSQRRNEKKLNKKRLGKSGWTVASLVTGIIFLMSAAGSTDSPEFRLGVAIVGAVLIAAAGIMKLVLNTRAKRIRTYEAKINRNGNTSIDDLAAAVGKPFNKVADELQAMIADGFFPEAYVDINNRMLVMTRNGIPLESVERSAAEVKAAKRKKSRDGGAPESLDDLIVMTDDTELKNKLKALRTITKKIDARVEAVPELEKQVKDFREKYYPEVVRLTDDYNEKIADMGKFASEMPKAEVTTDSSGAPVLNTNPNYLQEQADEIKAQLISLIDSVTEASENLLEKLHEDDIMDITTDIKMLQTTLASKGLLDSDFDI